MNCLRKRGEVSLVNNNRHLRASNLHTENGRFVCFSFAEIQPFKCQGSPPHLLMFHQDHCHCFKGIQTRRQRASPESFSQKCGDRSGSVGLLNMWELPWQHMRMFTMDTMWREARNSRWNFGSEEKQKSPEQGFQIFFRLDLKGLLNWYTKLN